MPRRLTARIRGFVRSRDDLALMVVWYAVALHLIWAICLFVSPAALHATAVAGPARLFPNRFGLAILLIAVASVAVISLFLKRLTPEKILLLVPQQLMLGLSAAAALSAMSHGHFADGVTRPHTFLVADQIPTVLALVFHSATIVILALAFYWRDAAER